MFRNFRIDIVIALCALLVSTLATAASWYQTRVIQQQLSAQVWPYLTVTEDISGDLFSLSIENDGLGPAVIRNLSASVDHRPVGTYVDLMHAILGPNIVRRKPPGEKMAMYQNSLSPATSCARAKRCRRSGSRAVTSHVSCSPDITEPISGCVTVRFSPERAGTKTSTRTPTPNRSTPAPNSPTICSTRPPTLR